MKYLDFHTHVFPPKIAAKAVKYLETYYHASWDSDGLPEHLAGELAALGTARAVIFSCATTPEQVRPANDFLHEIVAASGGRFFAFGTLHPDFRDIEGEIARMRELGLRGIKIHPDFQHIYANEPEMYRIYRAAGDLPVLIHAGDSRTDFSSPWRIAEVVRDFPELKIVAAHLGGVMEWDEARRHLAGRNLWLDTSSTMNMGLKPETAVQLIREHGAEKVLFGSDWPFLNCAKAVTYLRQLGLTEAEYELIFHRNAEKLLGLTEE